MENFPYFVRNLNPRLYIAQIQNLLKINYQTFFYKNLHEESSSFESSMDAQLFTCDDPSSSDECRCVCHNCSNEESSSSSEESSSVDYNSSDVESSSSSEESISIDHGSFDKESSSSPEVSSSLDYDSFDEKSSVSSDESTSIDHYKLDEESSSSEESSSVDYDSSDVESSSSSEETSSIDHDSFDKKSSVSSDESTSIDHYKLDEESSSSEESSSVDYDSSDVESSSSSEESSSIDHDSLKAESSSSVEDDPLTLSTLNSFLVISAILGALSTTQPKSDKHQSDTESSALEKVSIDDGYVLSDVESSSEESSSSSFQEYSVYSENSHKELASQTKSSIYTEQTLTDIGSYTVNSFENQRKDFNTRGVSAFEDENELPVNPLMEEALENKQEILEGHHVHTDHFELEKIEHDELTHPSPTLSNDHAETGNIKQESEEKRGLISLFESLPSNYPIKSIITNGTEIYVTLFIRYENDQQLVYFSGDNNVITIECHEIDGVIFGNDCDYESFD